MIRTKVRAWAERHALLAQGENIVAACSGGPDSLALVDLLEGLRPELDFSLFVAHFEHGLRGEESLRDAEFVRQFCADRGLHFFAGSADVKNEVLRGGGSIEEVSRRLRYEFLRQVAKELGGALIATGHHRDDQAETVLLNLIRGSGGRGLGAMRPLNGDIIHPLLCLTRAEIEAYCRDRGLQPRNDASNAELEFRRNRVRHELAPLLRERFNPSLTDTLCRTADILAEGQDFLRSYVEERLPKWALQTGNGYRLNATVFSRLHVAVQRELLLNLLEKLRGDIQGITFWHVEQIRSLFLQDSGSHRIDLPGYWQARKSYQDIFIEASTDTTEAGGGQTNSLKSASLACPGETFLPEFGITVHCSVHSSELPFPSELGPAKAAFDLAALRFPLTVRRRHPGDQFRPLGATGSRKLKELMIDLKIPVEQRATVPILCDEAGILWVVGCRRSQRARLSSETREYIVIEIIRSDNVVTGGNRIC